MFSLIKLTIFSELKTKDRVQLCHFEIKIRILISITITKKIYALIKLGQKFRAKFGN